MWLNVVEEYDDVVDKYPEAQVARLQLRSFIKNKDKVSKTISEIPK